ncbi:MAG: glycoside hydrolase/phage tail family protein [Paracoccaceae bacterium]
MATLVLSAAGSAAGGALGGPLFGLGAATLGRAAGAVAGGVLDQAFMGQGARAGEVGRASALRLQTATEGAALPIVYGRMRVAGTVIWSTRFLESVRESRQGGKATGGARVREYAYSISLAVALCEGPVERIGRVWADGALLDTAGLTVRLHRGDEAQASDPKIEAVEGAGNAPCYRGTAYLVFEDLPLGPFGNRIPQINVEVVRSARQPGVALDPVEAGPRLSEAIRAVALSPGTGEFALSTVPRRHLFEGGATVAANVNNPERRPDIEVALDRLGEELPNVEAVSLIVSWFGDDLRCGRCRVEPRIEERGRRSLPADWRAAGLTTDTARLVGRDAAGRPVYGGSPSDASVIEAIRALGARGYRVLVYPFLLMDIPVGNGLPDPYGRAEQPAHPWRGRITLDTAPGREGSADLTSAAADEVAAFFGTARASEFDTGGDEPVFHGDPGDLGWRRFVLHLAALARSAGGVDAICVGTEFRGLTQIRSGRTDYPAVAAFRDLAAEVRALLPETKISYAADWSEYFGHAPGDGSGDRIFHLDPLWADGNIDFVGIDDYMSAADWRHEPGHADQRAGAASVYSLAYLRSNIAGGENFDWYYASEDDRAAQVRTPIGDAYGEPWVWRPKDIAGWWSNPHHDRVGGVRASQPTPWVPGMKPVWLTETGCPAVDLGANRPNLFVDPKSSENGLPFGSAGARDDEMQRRFLQAKIGYWREAEHNPVSKVYGGPMMPPEGVFVWTWDARPWPDFPNRLGTWSDGVNHRLGHWITGRIAANGLAEVVAAICTRAGFTDYDVSALHGAVHGYVLDRAMTAREALQALMTVYGFDGVEADGRVVFRMRRGLADAVLDPGALVEGEAPGEAVEIVRASAGERPAALRLAYVDAEGDFRPAAAEAVSASAHGHGVEETAVTLAMPASMAQGTVERWAAERQAHETTATLALPPSRLAIEPGDVIALDGEAGLWRVDRAERGTASSLTLTAVDPLVHRPVPAPERFEPAPIAPLPGPLDVVAMDLPLADGGADDHRPRLAVAADPWPGGVDVWEIADEGAVWLAASRVPATIGRLASALPAGRGEVWQRASVEVALSDATLASATEAAVLAGANRLAVEHDGVWEVLAFREAVLIGVNRYRLSGLLRGRRGTEWLAARTTPAGGRVVALDRGVTTLPFGIEDLGRSRRLRVVPIGHRVDHPEAVEVETVVAGAGLRPFAPARLRARIEGGDAVLRWVRRTRVGGDLWVGRDVPLGEEAEAYEVRVLKDGRIARAVEVDRPLWRYGAAERAMDGTTGGFTAEIAQISAVAGPGTRGVIDVEG